MITALLVIGILVFLIVVHELGHFIAAKIFRVRVEEFGIGYPPLAFTFGKIGETEYTLNWIPFGGFVRLFGDIGEEQRGTGSFVDAHRGAQAMILIAGVAANAAAAWLLFAAALHAGIPHVVSTPQEGEASHLVVADVVPGSPADSAGIIRGDEILRLEDAAGVTLAEHTPEAVASFVAPRGGKPITMTYVRAHATSTATLIPAHAVIPEQAGRPALGIAVILVSSRSLTWEEATLQAIPATKNALATVAHGLWSIVMRAASGSPSLSDVIGPVGLVDVVRDAAESGVGNVLALAAFISVNLAIINLIPIPALDGGRLLILGIETALRRPVHRLTVRALNAIGIALIVALMVSVTYNDIVRLLA